MVTIKLIINNRKATFLSDREYLPDAVVHLLNTLKEIYKSNYKYKILDITGYKTFIHKETEDYLENLTKTYIFNKTK